VAFSVVKGVGGDSEMIEKRAEIDGYRINILVTHFLCYYILKVIQYIFRSQLFVATLLPFPQKTN